MASTNKTSLGLNMWEASDKPVRLDFNSDNAIIDEQIAKANSDIVKAKNDINRIDSNLSGAGIDMNNYVNTGVFKPLGGTLNKVGRTVVMQGVVLNQNELIAGQVYTLLSGIPDNFIPSLDSHIMTKVYNPVSDMTCTVGAETRCLVLNANLPAGSTIMVSGTYVV